MALVKMSSLHLLLTTHVGFYICQEYVCGAFPITFKNPSLNLPLLAILNGIYKIVLYSRKNMGN